MKDWNKEQFAILIGVLLEDSSKANLSERLREIDPQFTGERLDEILEIKGEGASDEELKMIAKATEQDSRYIIATYRGKPYSSLDIDPNIELDLDSDPDLQDLHQSGFYQAYGSFEDDDL